MKYRIVEFIYRYHIEIQVKESSYSIDIKTKMPVWEVNNVWYPIDEMGKPYYGRKDQVKLSPEYSLEAIKGILELVKKGPIIHEV